MSAKLDFAVPTIYIRRTSVQYRLQDRLDKCKAAAWNGRWLVIKIASLRSWQNVLAKRTADDAECISAVSPRYNDLIIV